MNATHRRPWRDALHAIGSLRVGTAVLAAMMLALGAATAIESSRGTEYALERIYLSTWFTMLLAMLGLNMIAAVAMRWPLQRKHIGFVLTHASVVAILLGAWTTRHFGIDGQLSIAEGRSRDSFTSTQEMLAIAYGEQNITVDLEPPIGGLESVDRPVTPDLADNSLGALMTIERYVPDSVVQQHVTDDGTDASHAVQVSVTRADSQETSWVFEGKTAHAGPASIKYRSATGEQMIGFLAAEKRDRWIAAGTISTDLGGTQADVSLAECLESPMPIGDSGYLVKVINVWTHASVRSDGELGNISSLPTNPAVELEITEAGSQEPGPVDRRLVFSEYPDFDASPDAHRIDNLKVTFFCPVVPKSETDVEIIRGPDGGIFARFTWEGTPEDVVRLEIGHPVETPWPERYLILNRRFAHANLHTKIAPPEATRTDRVPAMLVRVRRGEFDESVWVRRGKPTPVHLGDQDVQLVYTKKQRPLGFAVTLDQFSISYYPGTRRPRSFQSLLTFADQATGREEQRLVSMNHPTTYGGMTFFQSSYQMDNGRTRSVLSVSRDPGMTITFLGYLGTSLGMLVVLFSRMRDRRHGQHSIPTVIRKTHATENSAEPENATPEFASHEPGTFVRQQREVVHAAPEAKR